jgi:hypothetical protein
MHRRPTLHKLICYNHAVLQFLITFALVIAALVLLYCATIFALLYYALRNWEDEPRGHGWPVSR